jgi:hypothetical protein
MNEKFEEYMNAEICAMMKDIGKDAKPGSTRFDLKALNWIEKNAAQFRLRWDRANNKVIADGFASDQENA